MAINTPHADDFTEHYWQGCREGILRYRRCNACGRAHHYPRRFCPFCWSGEVEWRDATGTGTVYTYSVVHSNDLPPFRDRLPYVVAIVELDEGVRLDTNLVDIAPGELRVGLAVRAVFVDEGDYTVVRFTAR